MIRTDDKTPDWACCLTWFLVLVFTATFFGYLGQWVISLFG